MKFGDDRIVLTVSDFFFFFFFFLGGGGVGHLSGQLDGRRWPNRSFSHLGYPKNLHTKIDRHGPIPSGSVSSDRKG